MPAHYVWTPRGYVFVDGYYDYSVARRGVLFAPVYFNSASLSTARLLLLAGHGDQPGHLWQPPLLAAGLRPLLLRRLLRFELRHRGLFPLVFVQFQPLRL